jgi:hypothetical protein
VVPWDPDGCRARGAHAQSADISAGLWRERVTFDTPLADLTTRYKLLCNVKSYADLLFSPKRYHPLTVAFRSQSAGFKITHLKIKQPFPSARSAPPFRATAPQTAAGLLRVRLLGQIVHTHQRAATAVASADPPGHALRNMAEASDYQLAHSQAGQISYLSSHLFQVSVLVVHVSLHPLF